MDLEQILEDVAEGKRSVEEARRAIEGFTRVDDFARLDTGRPDRAGVPEVVLGEGKSLDHLESIVREFLEEQDSVIVSKVDEAAKDRLLSVAPEAKWYDQSKMVVLHTEDYEQPNSDGTVAVLSGGTADVPVAEEAVVIAEEMGCTVNTYYDVGVAGIHRLLSEVDRFAQADSLVVAAGREGALPTVVAGLVDVPVIGLPVSIGYGHGGEGEAALSGMLQSCTVLSTVNIDAGFVAGAQAAKIACRAQRE